MTNNSYQNWDSASRETVQIRVSVEPKPGRMMGKELGKRSKQLGKQAENRARRVLQLPEVGNQEQRQSHSRTKVDAASTWAGRDATAAGLMLPRQQPGIPICPAR